MIVSILIKHSMPQFYLYLHWNVPICESSLTQSAVPYSKQRNLDEVEGVMKTYGYDSAQCVKFGGFGGS
jgi:hypothetical protein